MSSLDFSHFPINGPSKGSQQSGQRIVSNHNPFRMSCWMFFFEYDSYTAVIAKNQPLLETWVITCCFIISSLSNGVAYSKSLQHTNGDICNKQRNQCVAPAGATLEELQLRYAELSPTYDHLGVRRSPSFDGGSLLLEKDQVEPDGFFAYLAIHLGFVFVG